MRAQCLLATCLRNARALLSHCLRAARALWGNCWRAAWLVLVRYLLGGMFAGSMLASNLRDACAMFAQRLLGKRC